MEIVVRWRTCYSKKHSFRAGGNSTRLPPHSSRDQRGFLHSRSEPTFARVRTPAGYAGYWGCNTIPPLIPENTYYLIKSTVLCQSVVIGSTSPMPLPRFCCTKMSIFSSCSAPIAYSMAQFACFFVFFFALNWCED